MMAGSLIAQTLPDGMVSLLPAGVTANIDDTKKDTQFKNIVVAGKSGSKYKAFFPASEAEHGEELWVTDGTVAGTMMVKDINLGPSSSDINWMARFNDKVVFAATDGKDGMELWISDGTTNGTYMVMDINEFGDSSPRGFTQVNETQFVFGAEDYDSQNYSDRGPQWWLWVSDGTSAGTKMIYQCDTKWPGQDQNYYTSPYMRVGRKVFFRADNKEGTVGEELWLTDGTTQGTILVKDINTEKIATGTANSAIDNMVNFYNEKLFFKAFSIESNNEPWATDGTTDGTFQIFDSNPTFDSNGFPRGGGASDVKVPYNGKVFFRGFSLIAGCELASTDLTPNNYTLWDINQNAPTSDNNSWPDVGCPFDSVYVFCANTGFDANLSNNYGGELHYTDGKTIKLQSDLAPGILCNWANSLTVVAGSLYFIDGANDVTDYKQKLFRIDSKDQFPIRVSNLNSNGDQITALRNLDGILLFSTFDAKGLYSYTYRKPNYDPTKDKDNLEIEYRTRAEIANNTAVPVACCI